jgi:hypothetical protein
MNVGDTVFWQNGSNIEEGKIVEIFVNDEKKDCCYTRIYERGLKGFQYLNEVYPERYMAERAVKRFQANYDKFVTSNRRYF